MSFFFQKSNIDYLYLLLYFFNEFTGGNMKIFIQLFFIFFIHSTLFSIDTVFDSIQWNLESSVKDISLFFNSSRIPLLVSSFKALKRIFTTFRYLDKCLNNNSLNQIYANLRIKADLSQLEVAQA